MRFLLDAVDGQGGRERGRRHVADSDNVEQGPIIVRDLEIGEVDALPVSYEQRGVTGVSSSGTFDAPTPLM
jgi:hypothetical protein